MDINALNKRLESVADKINKINGLKYDSEEYDLEEEELHNMEDELMDQYGDYLEEAFDEVHDEFCPDTDVLLPIAYLAKEYIKYEDGSYDVKYNQGVPVEVDDYPGKETKLALVPSPTRIILQIDENTREEVWIASN